MITSLKAEFRKLLTVRSTYFIALFAVAICSVLIGFWIYGYKDVEQAAHHSNVLLDSMFAAVGVAGVLVSFLAILLVGHEYRYNTIMYSLTSTNSRTRLFLVKWVAVAAFSLALVTVVVLLNWGLFYLGSSLHAITPTYQNVPVGDFIWRSGVSVLGSVSFAFIITMLLRNLISAIAVVLVLATTIEPLLTLLLKSNTKYLPYMALGNLTQVGSNISYTFSLLVVTTYVVVLGLVAYVLFLKRDAN